MQWYKDDSDVNKRIVSWGICLLGVNTTIGLRRDRSLAWGMISRLNASKKAILMRTFPPIYPLIMPVLDGYEDGCSIWMSEP